MGERVPTTIKFGGKLRAEHAERLIELLNEDNFYSEDADLTSGGDVDDVVVDHLDDTLRADEVNYGQIEDIIAFCREHKLDYEHWIDACGGGDPSVERVVAGTSETLNYSDGEPMIPLARVIKVETLVTGLADLIALAKRWSTPLKLEIVP